MAGAQSHPVNSVVATDLPEDRMRPSSPPQGSLSEPFMLNSSGKAYFAGDMTGTRPVRDFYFHLQTPEGLEPADFAVWCEGPEDAFVEACRAIPDIAAEMEREGRDPMECQFLIHNGKGAEMFMVPFSELIKKVPARARH
jgi:hypothetical protein